MGLPPRRLAAAAAEEAARLASYFEELDLGELDLEVDQPSKAPLEKPTVAVVPTPKIEPVELVPSPRFEPEPFATLWDVPERPVTFDDLSDDLIGWIFSFLPMEALVRDARAVCHNWYSNVNIVIDTYDVLEPMDSHQYADADADELGCASTPRVPLEESLMLLLNRLTPRPSPHWSPSPMSAPAAQAAPLRAFTRRLMMSEAPTGRVSPSQSDGSCSSEGGSSTDSGYGKAVAATEDVSIITPARTKVAARPARGRQHGNAAVRQGDARTHGKAAVRHGDARTYGKAAVRQGDARAFVAFCAAQADLQGIDEYVIAVSPAQS